MKLEIVYVTVGTTKFEALIREVMSDNVLRILKSRGCRQLILQLGKGRTLKLDAEKIRSRYGIELEHYDFKDEPTRTDIIRADLVIGHAGAGTCMDILRYSKPALIVVNDKLMGNHQAELALQLAAERYVFSCNVQQLAKQLQTLDFNDWRPYPFNQTKNNMNKFIARLDAIMSN